ncbi:SUKH-4 family immunity protein [Streptomyces yaizuensis]|uniref:Uncharacterized protein n=1 Tax=Streptomyces yaizuensis TaxID=2989713 RepID=A0ABQ5P965_9ACTN|nr:hypothetical protein [Streptomyces sp. YSPA8]GLF99130.1 hypothetical protein SYYSPA8_32555 [Streptomyces sp. YSPA8]
MADIPLGPALTDAVIARVLAPVVAGELVVPYPGRWERPPYASRGGRAVVAGDPGLSVLAVDRGSGAVVLLDDAGESTVNGSAAALVECARRYTAAIRSPESGDEEWEGIGQALLTELRAVDPVVADDEGFWAVAAEEVGYGFHALEPTPKPKAEAEPEAAESRPRLLLAMDEDRRADLFPSDRWRLLATAVRLTVAPPPERLEWALEVMEEAARVWERPAPRPDVLVYASGTAGTADTVGLPQRLSGLRLVCRIAAPGTPPRFDPAADDATGPAVAVVDGADPVAGILDALNTLRSPWSGH